MPADGEPEPVTAGQANRNPGLFAVTGGIYQLRGADLSNMTLVESDNGVIVRRVPTARLG